MFNGQADHIVLPGALGEMDVLPGHLPLLTSIAMGTLTVHEGSKSRNFFIEQGYAEILPNKVSILTEACDGVDDIDIAKAKLALEAAEKELQALEDRSRTEEIEGEVQAAHEKALERARMRLLHAEGKGH